MALLAAVSIVCAQSTVSDVFAAGAEEVAAQENNAVSIEYLTLQPGERDDSVNLNWYAPEGTQNAIVRMGDKTVEASVRALHTPTKVVEGKYTDTGKIVCQATVSGLSKGTEYSYQISYDNGNTWSKKYSYETPNAGEFRFGLQAIPRLKKTEKQITGDGILLTEKSDRMGSYAGQDERGRCEPHCFRGRPGGGSKLGKIQ